MKHLYHVCIQINIHIFQSLGFKEIEVTSKTLICGEKGIGAMAEVQDIVEKVKEIVSEKSL